MLRILREEEMDVYRLLEHSHQRLQLACRQCTTKLEKLIATLGLISHGSNFLTCNNALSRSDDLVAILMSLPLRPGLDVLA
jgi:hypothetical protein